MGFVKDAEAHIDVQGFNVYHKNRLIKVCLRIYTCGDGSFKLTLSLAKFCGLSLQFLLL